MANATSFMELNTTTNYTLSSNDSTLLGFFDKIFSDHLEDLEIMIKELFQIYTNKFYLDKAQKEILKFPVELFNNNKYNVDLIFQKLPVYNASKGIIYYYSGEVQKDVSSKFSSNDNIKWDNFSLNDGNLQIFLSSNIFEQISNDLSKTGSIKIIIDKNNLPVTSEFKLNIEYLGKIIPGIYYLTKGFIMNLLKMKKYLLVSEPPT